MALACDTMLRDQFQWGSPPLSLDGQEDPIAAIHQRQVRCFADVAALGIRCSALERDLEAVSSRTDLVAAAVSTRAPMLVASRPACPPAAAHLASVCAAVPSSCKQVSSAFRIGEPNLDTLGERVDELACLQTDGLKVLRRRMDEIEGKYKVSVNKLEAALDAARTGIAGLARDLHYDKEARKKVYGDLTMLAQDIGKAVVGPAMLEAEKNLRAKTLQIVNDAANKMKVSIDSRFQLMIAELRGEATVGCERLQATCPTKGKSLSDWLPEAVDGDVAATKHMLMQLKVFEHMAVGGSTPDDFVSRPTTRFLHRVVVAIKHATGYPIGILEDWPGPAEAKVDFVQRVWDSVSNTLGLQDLEFKAQDVLRCTNRRQTRRLLQLLSLAALQERRNVRDVTSERTNFDFLHNMDLPLSTLPSGGVEHEDAATSVCWH